MRALHILFLSVLVATLAIPSMASAQDHFQQFKGEERIDVFGYAVDGGQDVDADGIPDLVIGLPSDAIVNEGITGQARVISGATGDVLFILNGVGTSDSFGEHVAGVGDLNGDTIPDFIVGAHIASPGGVNRAGQARVFSGADGSILHDLAGPSPASFLGRSVAGAGDIDNDGTLDFIVGGVGFVKIYSGASGTVIRTLSDPFTSFGISVADAGLVDGDSIPDVMVGVSGAPGGGEARVYSGATGALIHTLTGASDLGLFGNAVASLGDLNLDGRADLAVGGPHHIGPNGRTGIIKVFSGLDGSSMYELIGAEAGAGLFGDFGESMESVADLDGDLKRDLLVGAPGAAKAVLLSGVDGSIIRIISGSINDGFAEDVAEGGDLDGDTMTDVLIGAPHHGDTVTAFSGATGAEILTVEGQTRFGESVGKIGDMDGDTVPDFVVGDSSAVPEGRQVPGRVVVLSGKNGKLIHEFEGRVPNDHFGFSVAATGDLNGDGHSEILVGAPTADPNAISNAGEAHLFSGADGSLLNIYLGTSPNFNLGRAVSRLDDVTGDGISDFAIAIPGENDVKVYSGATGTGFQTLSSSGPSFGYSIAQAGDHNGDGFPEILVGSPKANDDFFEGQAGRVEIFSGATGVKLYTWNGTQSSGEELGWSVAGKLDWNADGFPDVFAGGPVARPGGLTFAGRVKIFSGLNGSLLETINGPNLRGFYGRALTTLYDWDGDGIGELVVGSPFTDRGGPANPGLVYVYSGADHSLLRTFRGSQFYDRFGIALSGVGDLNGDGRSDLAVGMPGFDNGAKEQAGGLRLFSAHPLKSVRPPFLSQRQ